MYLPYAYICDVYLPYAYICDVYLPYAYICDVYLPYTYICDGVKHYSYFQIKIKINENLSSPVLSFAELSVEDIASFFIVTWK